MPDLNVRHFHGRGNEVVHEGGGQQLAVFIVHDLFVKSVANALGHASHDLTIHDEGVDDGATVMDRNITMDFDLEGFGIDF